MTRRIAIAALLLSALVSQAVHAAPEGAPPEVAALMQRDLADIPGKEVLMLKVTFPPGGVDPIHRHDAHGFIYVVQGTVVMGVRGGKEVTLKAGDTFYEGVDDVHTVGRNASPTEPATLVAVLLKKKGAPPLTLTK